MNALKIYTFILFFLVNNQLILSQTASLVDSFKVDIGIMDVFDTYHHFNHNQSFKLFLKDNPLNLNNKTATVDLVEHFSQAAVAINVKIGDARVMASFYKDGKLAIKDTIKIVAIEKNIPIFSPSFFLVQSPNGIAITGIQPKSAEYQNGIRNGHILQEVDGVSVVSASIIDVEKLIQSKKQKVLRIKVYNPETTIDAYYNVNQYLTNIRGWNSPLTHEDVKLILKEIFSSMIRNRDTLGIQFASKINDKSFISIAPQHSTRKCQAQEQIATYLSDTHPVSLFSLASSTNGVYVDSIFKNEKFIYPNKKEKKSNIGDAALYVMRYYNYDQNESYLGNHHSVATELQDAAKELSGPYYNKPGVFANYFVAAKEYEVAKNYPAALNQYYASLRKIDQVIASESTKLQAKKIVTGRIAFCSRQLGQHNYAEIMKLAQECLGETLKDREMVSGDKNFYDFSKEVSGACESIEAKLKEQRTEKTFAIVTAVASVAAGVGSLSLDATGSLATSLILNSVDIMDQNAAFNYEVNKMLWESTSTMTIHLPQELGNDERSPYEIVASAYINYSLERSTNKRDLLNRIGRYATDKPAIKTALNQTLEDYDKTGKLDQTQLVRAIVNHEITVYRYEKRGMNVPKVVTP